MVKGGGYNGSFTSRGAAANRIQSQKAAELVRRGSSSGNASKHASHMVAQQSSGDPNGNPPC